MKDPEAAEAADFDVARAADAVSGWDYNAKAEVGRQKGEVEKLIADVYRQEELKQKKYFAWVRSNEALGPKLDRALGFLDNLERGEAAH